MKMRRQKEKIPQKRACPGTLKSFTMFKLIQMHLNGEGCFNVA